MLFEVHCHTWPQSQCSTIDPVELLHHAVDKDVDGLIITEHHYLWNKEELEQLRDRAVIPSHFVLLAAQEVNTDIGHVLVYGAEQTIPEALPLHTLRQRWPHAALIWAHPWRSSARPSESQLRSQHLDGIEIFNNNHTPVENYTALQVWHHYKFTATAGSDAHRLEVVGQLPTQLDHPVHSIEEFAREVRAGRCRPYVKESVKSGRSSCVSKIVLGAKGQHEGRPRYIVRQAGSERAHWESLKRQAALTQELQHYGFSKGRFRVAAILGLDTTEHFMIEQGLRGKTLKQLLPHISSTSRTEVLRHTAQWLGQMHSARINVSDIVSSIQYQRSRFAFFMEKLSTIPGRDMQAIAELAKFVGDYQERVLSGDSVQFVQVHGDFQPTNIICGFEIAQEPESRFIGAIDFEHTHQMAPAYDVGYFLAQLQYQFRHNKQVYREGLSEEFIGWWQEKLCMHCPTGIVQQVEFFKLLTNLSILAFLVMVGRGTSEDSMALLRQGQEQMQRIQRSQTDT